MKKLLVVLISFLIVSIALFVDHNYVRIFSSPDELILDTSPVVLVYDTTAGDFIFDSTLQRLHMEVPEDTASIYEKGEEVTSADMAFKIAAPILMRAYGEEEILHQRPFHVNLVDSFWILYGTLPKAIGHDVLGGTAYIEIRKKNGGFVKCIHGE